MLYKYILEIDIDNTPETLNELTEKIRESLKDIEGIKNVLPTVYTDTGERRSLTLKEYNELLEYKSVYEGLCK